MATNNRDVKLGIEIQTAGEDDIARLATAVRSLGKEGDPAALGFNRLADELGRIAEQAGAVTALKALSVDVESLTAANAAAAAAAGKASDAYRDQKTAADALRDAQAQARVEVAQAKTAYDDLKLAFQTLRNAGRDATQTQDSFKAALADSRQVVDEQNRALKTRRDTLADLNVQVREAAAAEKALGQASDAAGKAASSTQGALSAQSSALAQVQAAALELGVDFGNLATAERQYRDAALEYVNNVAVQQRAARLDQAEADRLAAIEARGLADAQREGAAAAASELAAIKDSIQFLNQRAAAQAKVAAAAAADAAAEEQRVASLIEQNAADREAFDITQGLAAAQRDAAEAAASELAAIKDSATFLAQYAQAKRDAAAAADAQALADERASLAAKAAAAAEAEAIAAFSKAAEAAEITNFWATEIARMDVEAEKAAAATRELAAAGEALSKAFGQTGVRSLEAIRAEMAGVGEALALLQRQFNAGAIGADDLARATSSAQVRLATLRTELQTIPALPNAFEQINASVNDLIGRFGSLAAAVATFGFVAKPIFDTEVQIQALRRALENVTGSSTLAAQQIEFLRTRAALTGVSVGDLSKSFTLFESSMLQSGYSLKVTQDLFGGVSNAAARFGLSTDQVNSVLLALGQVANKGKVSLEEIQRQLGEALPGALKISADSLGLTTAQFHALVQEGKLLSEDFLPAFASQLQKLGGADQPVEGLAQSFNRFKNVLVEASQALVEGPLGTTLGVVLTSVAGVLRDVTVVAVGFSEALGIAGKTIALVAAAATGNIASFRQFKEEFADIFDTAASKVSAFESHAYSSGVAAKQAGADAATGGQRAAEGAKGYQTAATLVGQSGAAATTAAAAHVAAGATISAASAAAAAVVVDSAGKQAEANRAAAAAVTSLADGTAKTIPQIQAAYGTLIKANESLLKGSEQRVKAANDEGEASIKLAQISGDEARVKTASAAAAQANAAALSDELAVRQKEVDLLSQEQAAVKAAAGAESTWTAERRASIAADDQIIERKKADLELTTQQVAKAREIADALALSRQAYGDQSASLQDLGKDYDFATKNLEILLDLQKRGLATQAEVDEVTRKQAASENLYRDALKDSADATTRNNATLVAQTNLTLKQISAESARATASAAIATALGNESAATEANVRVKQLQIDSIEASTAATDKEADAIIALELQKQAAIKADDPLRAQLQQEIDLRITNAQAMKAEADAQRAAIPAIQAETEALQRRAQAAAFSNTASLDLSGLTAANAKTKADSSASNAARDLFNSTPIDDSVRQDLVNRKASGKLTAADLAAAQSNLEAQKNNYALAETSTPGTFSLEGQRDALAQYQLAQSILTQVTELAKKVAPSSAGTSSTTHTVNITVNGKPTTVNTASASDATALTSLLSQLESASRSAGYG